MNLSEKLQQKMDWVLAVGGTRSIPRPPARRRSFREPTSRRPDVKDAVEDAKAGGGLVVAGMGNIVSSIGLDDDDVGDVGLASAGHGHIGLPVLWRNRRGRGPGWW